jgi:hypothetical protein
MRVNSGDYHLSVEERVMIAREFLDIVAQRPEVDGYIARLEEAFAQESRFGQLSDLLK